MNNNKILQLWWSQFFFRNGNAYHAPTTLSPVSRATINVSTKVNSTVETYVTTVHIFWPYTRWCAYDGEHGAFNSVFFIALKTFSYRISWSLLLIVYYAMHIVCGVYFEIIHFITHGLFSCLLVIICLI